MQRRVWPLILLMLIAAWQMWQYADGPPIRSGAPMVETRLPEDGGDAIDFLPDQARRVVARILSGDGHPYRQDGGVFHNRERRLPLRSTGYYREYTVPTPGARDRGARRIVTGGDPPREFWYTADHYRSFRRFEAPR